VLVLFFFSRTHRRSARYYIKLEKDYYKPIRKATQLHKDPPSRQSVTRGVCDLAYVSQIPTSTFTIEPELPLSH
jgi:hypothetical protein